MKRQIIAGFFTTVISVTAFAQSHKCFEDGSQAERKEMVAAFMQKKYKDFEKQFDAICKKYAETISCNKEPMTMSKASTRMSEISRQSICAEVMRVDNGKKTTIFWLDDKKAPKRQ
ncbi:hypothetical protein [Bdellovibrio sp. HCB209]|uniref:hypothetical protein n=1 Tax=Bdellovibrio sp. HCB209 TaxID=3394354 RepID=UPI0039B36E84